MNDHHFSFSCSIKGIIFDLDGTLVDSVEDIALAINHALTQMNLTTVCADQVRAWIGSGLPVLCQRAAAFFEIEDRWREIEQFARPFYQEHCADTTALFDGMADVIAHGRERKIPMAVLSNKPHDMVVKVLRALELNDAFVTSRGYVDEQSKKPSPSAALEICQSLNYQPDRVAMIGDSVIDIQTARNAGLISIAVTWGCEPEEFLRDAGPDCIVSTPQELIDIFAKNC